MYNRVTTRLYVARQWQQRLMERGDNDDNSKAASESDDKDGWGMAGRKTK